MSEEKAIKSVTFLMQNVVNKLDDISKKIESQKLDKSTAETYQKISAVSIQKSELIIKEIDAIKEVLQKPNDLNEIESSLTDLRQGINNMDVHFQKVLKTKPANVTTNNKSVTVFGDDATFSVKTLFILLAFTFICWSAIKFLPSYFSERSELEKEKQLYYEYYKFNYYLNFEQEDKKGIKYMEKILGAIESNDSSFVKKYEELKISYSNELKKRELENQLKQLSE